MLKRDSKATMSELMPKHSTKSTNVKQEVKSEMKKSSLP